MVDYLSMLAISIGCVIGYYAVIMAFVVLRYFRMQSAPVEDINAPVDNEHIIVNIEMENQT